MTVLLRTLFPAALLVPSAAAAQPAPGWDQAKKDVLADYRKQQPGDKVLEITGPERREGVAKARHLRCTGFSKKS